MEFIWISFAIFIALKILHVLKIFIFDFKNDHPILDFLTRRGKFISFISDFYLFFYAIFSAELKKKRARADWAKGPADGPPAASPPPARRAAAGVRRPHAAPVACADVPAVAAAARCATASLPATQRAPPHQLPSSETASRQAPPWPPARSSARTRFARRPVGPTWPLTARPAPLLKKVLK